MWARFTVLNETPIASAIAGCVIPFSRSNTIWMRSRCAAGIFHRRAVLSCRICFLVHLTIRPPESDGQSESYYQLECEPEKYRKPRDSISYGSGIRDALAGRSAAGKSVSRQYGAKQMLQRWGVQKLHEVICAVSFPGLDLSRVRPLITPTTSRGNKRK